MASDDAGVERTEVDGREFPTPGLWSLNWATDHVVSWYYGEKTKDAAYAHYFDCRTGHYIDVDGTKVDLSDVDRKLVKSHIANALQEHKPYV